MTKFEIKADEWPYKPTIVDEYGEEWATVTQWKENPGAENISDAIKYSDINLKNYANLRGILEVLNLK